jgi:hypothetical protein
VWEFPLGAKLLVNLLDKVSVGEREALRADKSTTCLLMGDRQPGYTQKFTTNGSDLRLANRLLVYNRKFRSGR